MPPILFEIPALVQPRDTSSNSTSNVIAIIVGVPSTLLGLATPAVAITGIVQMQRSFSTSSSSSHTPHNDMAEDTPESDTKHDHAPEESIELDVNTDATPSTGHDRQETWSSTQPARFV
jgi:hypothetical protein